MEGGTDGAPRSELSRRELIRRGALAAGIAGVAGGFAWATPALDTFLDGPHRPDGPAPQPAQGERRLVATGPNCCQCANSECGCIAVTTYEECAIYCGDPAYAGLAEILGTVHSLRDKCGPPDFRVGASCTPNGCAPSGT